MSLLHINHINQLSRRGFLGAATATLVACGGASVRAADLFPTPKQTEGPFYPDKLPLDQDNDLLQVQGSTVTAKGTVANVYGRILGPDGKPINGAIVEIWQCDANGVYLHTKGGDRAKMDAGFQGFGRFKVGEDGAYRFRTIRPVPYTGRTPHIHYKIKLGEAELLTTQCYVNSDPGNAKDGIFKRITDPASQKALIADFVATADGKEMNALFDVVLGKTPQA